MREIKFRGKNRYANNWFYGYLTKEKNKYYITSDTNSFYEVIPETIGQFTGLYDKNNTPIYEGDLIKYACGGTEDYVIQEIDEVFFNNEYGTFEIAINKNKENSEVLGFWLADLYEDSFYQVIGNIYDNEVK